MKKYNEFVKLNELFATVPVNMDNVDDKNTDKEILRTAIVAELDAVSFYEQMAENTKNDKLKKLLLDVSKEEKTHVGEFQAMLKELDPEYKEELKNGREEVDKMNKDEKSEEEEED